MKRLNLAVLTILICQSSILMAQEIRELDASPLDPAVFRPDGQNAYPVARIIYSRPQKKSRVMLGGIEQYGKVWRLGANQSTELNLYKNVSIEGNKLKSGSYTMYAIPNEKEWTIIFNSKLFTWGAFDYDNSKDVLRINVPVKKVDNQREVFGMAFSGFDGKGTLLIAWEDVEVSVPFNY